MSGLLLWKWVRKREPLVGAASLSQVVDIFSGQVGPNTGGQKFRCHTLKRGRQHQGDILKRLFQSILSRSKGASAEGDSSREVLPPKSLQNFVGGVYKEVGTEFVHYLVELCGLRPGDSVLDVGCGSGRMALPLTSYLSGEGHYAGFDISAKAIAWCKKNISRPHPNFDFEVADIYNSLYNPKGKFQSLDFRFPYPDASFDVVFLTSVFTHMFPPDIEHYLEEIARVMKPGGRCLCTFFVLNEESLTLVEAGKGTLDFKHERPGYRTTNEKQPEDAIAFPEAFIRDLYDKCGLNLRDPLQYGSWCGRKEHLSFQDVLIADKPAN